MATTKATELSQFSSDLTVDEGTTTATYSGTISATSGYQNLPTQFTVFGRSVDTSVPVANGVLTVIGRSSNTNIGIS